jgi:crotonobetainyl-CoA:carnitine CoA-transferase CaiB-like acyl-CoA transferase
METTDPGLMRRAMLDGVHERAVTDEFDFDAELRAILAPLGLKPEDSGGTIRTDKRDPLMRSQVRLGTASALALVQQSVVATHIWKLRTGLGQDISVDLGQAIRRLAPATEFKWETINGLPPAIADKTVGAYLGFFPAKDGRHVIPANIYPDIKSRMLSALDCADNPRALGAAIARYTADELEQMGEAGGFVMGKVRSVGEFVNEPVFEYLASRPLIEITKVGDSPAEPFPEFGTAPLSGIRALGMGHVIAGAGIGRSLASLGADVLNLWRAMEWEHEALLITANVGMRSARVNVRSQAGREQVYGLLRDADVFFANRRPGLLDDLGLDAETAAAIRPGLIHVTVSTHGQDGPWRNRVGFDQVAGTVTGVVAAEGTLESPQLPPTSIVNDYLVAWLGATGAMTALARRAAEGGSYQVHVSLDRAAMWILSLGLFAKDYVPSVVGTGGQHELIDPQLFTSLTPLGIYQGVTENVTLSRTPHHYANVLSPQGADQAAWLPKPEALAARNVLEVLMGRT